MSNILEKKLSFLDRLPSACRMRDRDTAGGRIDPHDKKKKKTKKRKEHFRKNWDIDPVSYTHLTLPTICSV